jgi:hypothetical protein
MLKKLKTKVEQFSVRNYVGDRVSDFKHTGNAFGNNGNERGLIRMWKDAPEKAPSEDTFASRHNSTFFLDENGFRIPRSKKCSSKKKESTC